MMEVPTAIQTNLRQAVPFFMIRDMDASLQFYTGGLGFELTHSWTPRGNIEWCNLRRGSVNLMLQEYRRDLEAVKIPEKAGEGVTICFFCEDALALYQEFISKGMAVKEPFVGNGLWVVELVDPDGYQLLFESDTDVTEGTTYSEWKKQNIA